MSRHRKATRWLLAVIAVIPFSFAYGGIINGASGLNTINDGGNASNGLHFLDVTFSAGMTLDDALTNAQLTHSGARLALAQEWDDLFAASGISYTNPPYVLSDAFTAGASVGIAGHHGYSDHTIWDFMNTFGYFSGGGSDKWLQFWSDPDGDADSATTRDSVTFYTNPSNYSQQVGLYQSGSETPIWIRGWMLVVEPEGYIRPYDLTSSVPAPTSVVLLMIGLIGLGASQRAHASK